MSKGSSNNRGNNRKGDSSTNAPSNEGKQTQQRNSSSRLRGSARNHESSSRDPQNDNNPEKIYHNLGIDKLVNDFTNTLLQKINGNIIKNDVKPLVVKRALATLSSNIDKYCDDNSKQQQQQQQQHQQQQQQHQQQQQQQQQHQQQQFQLQRAFLIEDGVATIPSPPLRTASLLPPAAPLLRAPSNQTSPSKYITQPRGPFHGQVKDSDALVDWTHAFLKNFDVKFICFDHFQEIFPSFKSTHVKTIREVFLKNSLFKIYDKGNKLCLSSRGINIPLDNKLVYPIDTDCGIAQISENEYRELVYRFLFDFQIKGGVRVTILNRLFKNRALYFNANAPMNLFLKDVRFKSIDRREVCLHDYTTFISNITTNVLRDDSLPDDDINNRNNTLLENIITNSHILSNSNPAFFPHSTNNFMSGFLSKDSSTFTSPNNSGKSNMSINNLNGSTNRTTITSSNSKVVNMSQLRRSKIPHIIEGHEPLDLWIARNWNEVDAWIDEQRLLDREADDILTSMASFDSEDSKIYLGMDAEWKPNFVKGHGENPVSVIQLSTASSCLVIQIIYMIEGNSRERSNISRIGPYVNCSEKFRAVMRSEYIVKVGVGIKNDLLKLKRDLNVDIGAYDEIAEIDETLARLVADEDGGQSLGTGSSIKSRSLQHYCNQYLNYNLSKTKKLILSNWSNKDLSNDQIIYAAYDALASKCIYDSIIMSISSSNSSNPESNFSAQKWLMELP